MTSICLLFISIVSATPVWATPTTEIIENQQKYEELNQKIDKIQAEIYSLNGQISPLAETIVSAPAITTDKNLFFIIVVLRPSPSLFLRYYHYNTYGKLEQW